MLEAILKKFADENYDTVKLSVSKTKGLSHFYRVSNSVHVFLLTVSNDNTLEFALRRKGRRHVKILLWKSQISHVDVDELYTRSRSLEPWMFE